MEALGLREVVSLAINCFNEGLESKAETVDKIVNFVEKEYVKLGDLKEALQKMERSQEYEGAK